MSDKEAFALIAHRARELSELPQIRVKMLEPVKSHGNEAAMRMVYMMAIATLAGA